MASGSKAGGVVKQVSSLLERVGIKAPWKYTGPASSPEYQNHLPRAVDYRRHAPASAPVRAAVPQAEEDKVYNIKYYTRDSRRDVYPGGPKKLEQYPYKVGAADEAVEAGPSAPTPGQQYGWSKPRSILDQDNNGYTL